MNGAKTYRPRSLKIWWLVGILPMLLATSSSRAEDVSSAGLQQHFDTRYQSFLEPSSASLLPFPTLEHQAWKTLLASGHLQPVFTKPDVFYNNETYTFSMYRADDGSYYLDAKGGFWGMGELVYGPIAAELLQ
jgi:hypothetical protein